MTEKVKLTREQAEAVTNYLNFNDISKLLDMHAGKKAMWEGTLYESLSGLSQADMARALLIGYEVEEEYKVGDWLTHDDGTVAKVVKIERNIIFVDFELSSGRWMNTVAKYFRYATTEEIKAEQERRTWAKIGRDVGEFRDGDSGIHSNGGRVTHLDLLRSSLVYGELKGFYPAESFIEFGGGNE